MVPHKNLISKLYYYEHCFVNNNLKIQIWLIKCCLLIPQCYCSTVTVECVLLDNFFCHHLPVFIYLSLTTCLYLPSLSNCLYLPHEWRMNLPNEWRMNLPEESRRNLFKFLNLVFSKHGVLISWLISSGDLFHHLNYFICFVSTVE